MAKSVQKRLSVGALTRTNPERANGFRTQVLELVPHLAELGIDVSPFTIPADWRLRRRFWRQLRRFDVVWLHRHIMWPIDLWGMRRACPRVVFEIDDPVGLSSSRPRNFSLTKALKFRATVRAATAVIGASHELVRIASRLHARVHYVPVCIDRPLRADGVPTRAPSEPLRLLWQGSKGTFKYLAAVMSHLEAIGQGLTDVELVVVGHDRLELEHLKVTNLPWSPAVEAEQLRRCHVGLVPLPDNAWTRGKATQKPLQYLSQGLPILASPLGVSVTMADGGVNGLLATSPDEWVEAVRRLRDDEPLRQQMGQAGIEYVRRHHLPATLARQAAEALREAARAALRP